MTNLEFIQQLWMRYTKIEGSYYHKDIRYYLQEEIIRKVFIGRIGEWSSHTLVFKFLKKLSIQTNDIFIPLFWKFLREKGLCNNFFTSFNSNRQDLWRSENFVNYSDVATYLENTNPAYFIQHAFSWMSDRSVDWCTIHLKWQEEIAKILTQEHVQKN